MASICTYMHVYCTYMFLFYIFLPPRRGRGSLPAEGHRPVQRALKKVSKTMQNAFDVFRSRTPVFPVKGVTSTTMPYWHICCLIFLRYISSFVIYTYIYVHTCIYVHIHPFKSMYLHIHAYTYVYVHFQTPPNRCRKVFWRGSCRRFLAAVCD